MRAEIKKDFDFTHYDRYREWAYKGVKRCIIAEKYMEETGSEGLKDYKFWCFNGEPLYCQIIADRASVETMDFYDMEWRHQEFVGLEKLPNAKFCHPKPEKFDQMATIARQLSQGHDFLRVDLYYIDGAIYFGELTFYPTGGFGSFYPEKWNEILGEKLQLTQRNSVKNKA